MAAYAAESGPLAVADGVGDVVDPASVDGDLLRSRWRSHHPPPARSRRTTRAAINGTATPRPPPPGAGGVAAAGLGAGLGTGAGPGTGIGVVTACVGMMVDGVFDGGLGGVLGGTGMGSVGVPSEEPHRAQKVPLSCWAPHCGQNMASLPRRGPVGRQQSTIPSSLRSARRPCPSPEMVTATARGDRGGRAPAPPAIPHPSRRTHHAAPTTPHPPPAPSPGRVSPGTAVPHRLCP